MVSANTNVRACLFLTAFAAPFAEHHHSFQEDGSHIADCVQCWSDDTKQDPHVHWRNMQAAVEWVTATYENCEAAKWTKPTELHVWTDGCAEQYKGRRNFRYLSESRVHDFWEGFDAIIWNFACSHHFAGNWDGEGGKAKTHCLNAKGLLHDARLCVDYLNSTFTRTSTWSKDQVNGIAWNRSASSDAAAASTYKINQRHFVHYLSGVAVRKDEKDASSIKGTHDHYQYRMDPQTGHLLLRKFSCYCKACAEGPYSLPDRGPPTPTANSKVMKMTRVVLDSGKLGITFGGHRPNVDTPEGTLVADGTGTVERLEVVCILADGAASGITLQNEMELVKVWNGQTRISYDARELYGKGIGESDSGTATCSDISVPRGNRQQKKQQHRRRRQQQQQQDKIRLCSSKIQQV